MAKKKVAKKSKKGMSTGKKVAIGAGIAAAGVAAYLLFGPDGKKNRKIVSTKLKHVNQKELKAVVAKLGKHWKTVSKKLS